MSCRRKWADLVFRRRNLKSITTSDEEKKRSTRFTEIVRRRILGALDGDRNLRSILKLEIRFYSGAVTVKFPLVRRRPMRTSRPTF